jgi:hypothetical protein
VLTSPRDCSPSSPMLRKQDSRSGGVIMESEWGLGIIIDD